MFDIVLKNGKIIDGTGAPWVKGDLGLRGEKIEAVGKLDEAQAHKVIDLEGKVVCPGIVDMHSHTDWSITLTPDADSSIRQGVTTEVVGNCGMSMAPVSGRNYHLVRNQLWGGEDEQMEWKTMADWLDCVERKRPAINIAALVGHGTIRSAVIGDESRHTTPDELEQMKVYLRQALDDGAFGLSSGLEYFPANATTTEELVELCRLVAGYGRLYATHMRDRAMHYVEAVQECISIAEMTGVAFQCSHMGAKPGPGDRDQVQETVMNMLVDARNRGVDILADVCHVYQWGNGELLSMLPPWVTEGGLEKGHQYLKDPQARGRIKKDFNRYWLHPREGRWDEIRLRVTPGKREWEGFTLAELIEKEGKDGYDIILDVLDADPGMRALANGMEYTLKTVQLQAESPYFAIASDSTALSAQPPYSEHVNHPFHYGWVPHVFARWVRERKWLSLEEAIRRMTSLPAMRCGIPDRGLIRPGCYADLMVFDELKVLDTSTFENPISYPIGIPYVFVNGQIAVWEGQPATQRAGRVLRW